MWPSNEKKKKKRIKKKKKERRTKLPLNLLLYSHERKDHSHVFQTLTTYRLASLHYSTLSSRTQARGFKFTGMPRHFTPHKSQAIQVIMALETCSLAKSIPVKRQQQDQNRFEIPLNNSQTLCLSFDCKPIVKMGLSIPVVVNWLVLSTTWTWLIVSVLPSCCGCVTSVRGEKWHEMWPVCRCNLSNRWLSRVGGVFASCRLKLDLPAHLVYRPLERQIIWWQIQVDIPPPSISVRSADNSSAFNSSAPLSPTAVGHRFTCSFCCYQTSFSDLPLLTSTVFFTIGVCVCVCVLEVGGASVHIHFSPMGPCHHCESCFVSLLLIYIWMSSLRPCLHSPFRQVTDKNYDSWPFPRPALASFNFSLATRSAPP